MLAARLLVGTQQKRSLLRVRAFQEVQYPVLCLTRGFAVRSGSSDAKGGKKTETGKSTTDSTRTKEKGKDKKAPMNFGSAAFQELLRMKSYPTVTNAKLEESLQKHGSKWGMAEVSLAWTIARKIPKKEGKLDPVCFQLLDLSLSKLNKLDLTAVGCMLLGIGNSKAKIPAAYETQILERILTLEQKKMTMRDVVEITRGLSEAGFTVKGSSAEMIKRQVLKYSDQFTSFQASKTYLNLAELSIPPSPALIQGLSEYIKSTTIIAPKSAGNFVDTFNAWGVQPSPEVVRKLLKAMDKVPPEDLIEVLKAKQQLDTWNGKPTSTKEEGTEK